MRVSGPNAIESSYVCQCGKHTGIGERKVRYIRRNHCPLYILEFLHSFIQSSSCVYGGGSFAFWAFQAITIPGHDYFSLRCRNAENWTILLLTACVTCVNNCSWTELLLWHETLSSAFGNLVASMQNCCRGAMTSTLLYASTITETDAMIYRSTIAEGRVLTSFPTRCGRRNKTNSTRLPGLAHLTWTTCKTSILYVSVDELPWRNCGLKSTVYADRWYGL